MVWCVCGSEFSSKVLQKESGFPLLHPLTGSIKTNVGTISADPIIFCVVVVVVPFLVPPEHPKGATGPTELPLCTRRGAN